MALPSLSVTVTARGTAKSVPSSVTWDVPAPAVMAKGAEATFLSVKVAVALNPAHAGRHRVSARRLVPATSAGLVATPDWSVWAVALDPPPTKLAPAPLAVATLKSTVSSGTGSP